MEQLLRNLILPKKIYKLEMIMNLLSSSSFCFYLAYLVFVESYISRVHYSGNVKEQCRDDSPIHTQPPKKSNVQKLFQNQNQHGPFCSEGREHVTQGYVTILWYKLLWQYAKTITGIFFKAKIHILRKSIIWLSNYLKFI